MMALAPGERTRLAKLLGLLGSEHPGERDAAGLAAARLVRARGMTWGEVLEQQGAACAPSAARRGFAEDPSTVDLQMCGQRLDLLTPWERGFVIDLAKVPFRRFSARQRAILADIAAKVRAAG